MARVTIEDCFEECRYSLYPCFIWQPNGCARSGEGADLLVPPSKNEDVVTVLREIAREPDCC